MELSDALIARLSQKRQFAEMSLAKALAKVKRAKKTAALARKAQALLQAVAKTVQEKAHKKITTIVTRCLAAVFPNPYTFTIKFEKKRGKTEAVPVFVRDGHEYGPTDGVGGGNLDVAAFGLRVAEVLMQQPPVQRLLILDEPFKFPSNRRRNYRERIKDLLLTLADELNFQFVIITHDPTFEVDTVIDLDLLGRTTT